MPTKSTNPTVPEVDLQKRLDAMDKIIATQEAKIKQMEEDRNRDKVVIEEQKETIDKLIAKGAGWLVIAMNALFDGEVFGVKFLNGQAWIPTDRKVAHFEFEPMKDTQLEKFKPDEQKRIREREKIPSAQRAVNALESDFGFRAIYFDGNDQNAIQNMLDARVKERADLQAKLDAETSNVETLIRPHFMG